MCTFWRGFPVRLPLAFSCHCLFSSPIFLSSQPPDYLEDLVPYAQPSQITLTALPPPSSLVHRLPAEAPSELHTQQQHELEPDREEKEKPEQGKPEQEKPEQEKPEQGKPEQEKPEQGKEQHPQSSELRAGWSAEELFTLREVSQVAGECLFLRDTAMHFVLFEALFVLLAFLARLSICLRMRSYFCCLFSFCLVCLHAAFLCAPIPVRAPAAGSVDLAAHSHSRRVRYAGAMSGATAERCG